MLTRLGHLALFILLRPDRGGARLQLFGFVGPVDDEPRQAARTEGYQHASPHLCLVGQFVRHEVGEDLVDRQRKDNADGHRIAGDGLKKAANDIIRMRGATMVS